MKYNDNGLWKTLNVKVTDTLPVGTIMPYAGTTIPSNYMKCEGQELSRIEYDILFSAIGTTYGVGDGSTTFNLPNLKGRVITGIDSNDTAFDTLGEAGGEKTHTLTVDEMPSHNHELGYKNASAEFVADGRDKGDAGRGTTSASPKWHTFNAGGGQSHNNLQPYIVLNYIIKVLDAPAIQAQVVNGYSTSSRDSYSCNYINNEIKDVYSTNETVIGKWINNKPIYRKVITFTTGNSAGDINIAHNINNAEMFTNVYAFTYRDNDGEERMLPNLYKDMQSMYTIVVYSINRTNVQISYGSMRINMNGYIILEYTKTTD